MSALAWLLWLASVWAVFFLFALSDLPLLLERTAGRLLRQTHLPHWARHGHAPPASTGPDHGRHARPH